MRRAIVTFIQNKYTLKLQLYGLFMSLKYIQCPDTDLIVFADPHLLSLLKLKCIKVPYQETMHPSWQDYPFIYSLSCLNSPNASILDSYDYLLRTDVDTFLSYKWNDFNPTHYSFGKGGYVNTPYVQEKILETAHVLGLNHHGVYNIGSTHYGPTSLVKEVQLLATEVTDYLLHHGFNNTSTTWPDWFRGVASMYGCEIAVNHLVTDYTCFPNDFDYPSTASDSIKEHVHIHCWHTDQFFSKTKFSKYGYQKIKSSYYAPDPVNYYCLHMARLGKNLLTKGKENLFL